MTSRIPESLQSVFLASNRGEVVDVAPPNSLAAKIFGRFTKSLPKPSILRHRESTSRSTSTASPTSSEESLCWSPLKSIASNGSARSQNKRQSSLPSEEKRPNPILESRCSSPVKSSSIRHNSPRKSPSKRSSLRGKQEQSSSGRSSVARTPSSRVATISPEDYLNALMRNRGYDIVRHHTLDTGFHKHTTELQIASYQPHVIELAQKNQKELRAVLCAGLSANPCNIHGESLLHSVCRRNLEALQVLIECGTDLHVSDDYGRTPLHDACWNNKPNFEVIDCLLAQDTDGPRFLFHTLDRHGGSPLSYVDKTMWHDWLCYLEARKDQFWPVTKTPQEITKLYTTLKAKPKTSEVTQPCAVLPPHIATDVATGRLAPSEAMLFVELSEADDSDSCWSDSSSESSEGDYSLSDSEDEETVVLESSGGCMDLLSDKNNSHHSTDDTSGSDDEEAFSHGQSSWGAINLSVPKPGDSSFKDLGTSWGQVSFGAWSSS